MTVHRYDCLIVGAGGAGLYAALALAQKKVNVAVLTKLYPTRSHTGAAQGGVSAALGNTEPDNPEWHMFDTVKGGDYLGRPGRRGNHLQGSRRHRDRAGASGSAVQPHARRAHRPAPLRRPHEGPRQGPVRRACYAADRTGHMILQTLYQQCIKNDVSSSTSSMWST
jgi:succinate dehydrogenase / fumarate reductase flavoprotein subunit